jgi:hypothetical protein
MMHDPAPRSARATARIIDKLLALAIKEAICPNHQCAEL